MEKILIVEDDIAFGTMIQTWLRKKGFEVEKTTSVKAAIQVCEEAERGFDLVLSDLRLPDHDGIFLLQWMRKHGVQVPFIVMTSEIVYRETTEAGTYTAQTILVYVRQILGSIVDGRKIVVHALTGPVS